jgi:lysophospholipase L1-like esterase
MRYCFFVVVIALFFLPSYLAWATEVEMPGQVRVVGRYEITDAGGVKFGWPGTALVFRFEGQELSVKVRDGGDNMFVVVRDGAVDAVPLEMRDGTHLYVLADGLDSGVHEVRLVRRTEGFFGDTTLLSAHTDGRFLVSSKEAGRSMLVIGDSISAGYGVGGESAYCGFSAATESQYETYAARAARHFGAELTSLAYSGKGLILNNDGSKFNTMSHLYRRASPNHAGDWDEVVDMWDVIVVHLGTNDFEAGVEPEVFALAYEEFLRALRLRYPDAYIYALIGPMLPKDKFEAARGAIAKAEEALGDERVSALVFHDDGLMEDKGCNWHPNIKGHAKMATIFIEALSRDVWMRDE